MKTLKKRSGFSLVEFVDVPRLLKAIRFVGILLLVYATVFGPLFLLAFWNVWFGISYLVFLGLVILVFTAYETDR